MVVILGLEQKQESTKSSKKPTFDYFIEKEKKMNNKAGFILTDRSLTLRWNDVTRTVDRNDSAFDTVLNYYREGKYDEALASASPAEKIVMYGNGLFGVLNGVVIIDGVEAPEELNREILTFIEQKLPPEPLVKFVQRVRKNPSYRSVNQLWGFVKANSICLTEDGELVLYKRVLGPEKEYFDIHTGHTHKNTPGETIRMPRNLVDDDPTSTCSHGLHVAAWEYAHKHFGSTLATSDVIMECLVCPSNVVSIPTDYNNAKMRVCEYTVLGIVQNPESSALKVVPRAYVPDNSFSVTEDEEEENDSDDDDDTYENECDNCGSKDYDCECNLCDDCGLDEDYDCRCHEENENQLELPLTVENESEVEVPEEVPSKLSTAVCCAAVATACVHANCSAQYCDVFSNDE